MSLEEYLALTELTGGLHHPKSRKIQQASKEMKIRKASRVGKKDPKMARALRKANAMGRKKAGGYKKGWSQGKIMKKAHQLRRKMR